MTDPQLAAAHTALKNAEKALDEKRDELFKAIGDAVTSGRVRQTDAASQLGYTREHVRRICKGYTKWKNGETTELKIAR